MAEIDKALGEVNAAQSRLKKAERFLLHYGNTPSSSSAHYYYARKMRDVHQYFTGLRVTMADALDEFKKRQREDAA
ncbi:MAG: hypothetical protein AMJ72_12285 [Acidithiobacillales bacterium SM1_46]|nr:MAG: hypothetical protein AMJ72_12285 [Acidithiobacillales bacterium SM1_46]